MALRLGLRRVSWREITLNRGGAVLLVTGLVDTIGTGLYLAGAAIFFTRVLGLSPASVGVGLSVGGLGGFMAQPVVGWMGDRWGPQRILVVLNLFRATGFTAYAFTDSFTMFVVVSALVGIGEHGAYPLYQALAERVAGLSDRVRMMARMRVVDNVGLTLGGLLAAAAISQGTRPVFDLMMVGNAVTFVIAAVLLARLRVPPAPAGHDNARALRGPLRLRALRDGRYVALAAVNGVLVLHMVLLGIAVPLWMLHTSAPPALVGVLFVVNTVLAVLLQVRASRGADTVEGGVAALRRAGVALACCCVLLALAPLWQATAPAVITLVVGVAALTAGELFQSAGAWRLSYLLAPMCSRAEYLATFNLGTSLQLVVGPILVTVGVVHHGAGGWLALAGCFLLSAAAVGPLVARAARRPILADADAVRAYASPPARASVLSPSVEV